MTITVFQTGIIEAEVRTVRSEMFDFDGPGIYQMPEYLIKTLRSGIDLFRSWSAFAGGPYMFFYEFRIKVRI